MTGNESQSRRVIAARYLQHFSRHIMLLLSEATLFFWNIPRSDGSKTKNELVSRITKWRGSVATGEPIKGHIRTSSGSSTLANQFVVVKARKTTVSDDTPQTQDAPAENLVGGFGDEVDDSQERAALGQGTEKSDQVRHQLLPNFGSDVC